MRLGFVGCCGVTELRGEEITQKVSIVSFQAKFGSPYQKFINPPLKRTREIREN